MLEAVSGSIGRSIVLGLGGLALAAGLALGRTTETQATYRLDLHAPIARNALYLTAWDRGPFVVTLTEGKLTPLTFRMVADVFDGCRWEATETLTPINGGAYAYDYDERILSCQPGATPTTKTPRQGTVTVTKL